MEAIDANKIRSMTAQELVLWFAEQRSITVEENSKEIYDIWAMLKELDTSSGLTRPYRGMILFKISSILGIRTTGTRFLGSEPYDQWSTVDLDIRQNLPPLFVELHSWIVGRDIRGEGQGVDYVISPKTIPRVINILKLIIATLEKLSVGSSTRENVFSLSFHPTDRPSTEKTDEPPKDDTAVSQPNTDVQMRYWLEGLYALALGFSDDLLGSQDSEYKKSLHEALQLIDGALQKFSSHWFYAPTDTDHHTELSNKIKDDQFWISPVANIGESEDLPSPPVNFQDLFSIGDIDYRTQQMLHSEFPEEPVKETPTVQNLLQPSVDAYLTLTQDDFEFFEPELRRTRASFGYFQAFQTVMNLSRYDPQVLSLIEKECPSVREALCSHEAIERILKEIVSKRNA